MKELLLIHHSDTLFDTLKPPTNNRPLFYWYTDRLCSHEGTAKYLYIFLINPKRDSVQLRARRNGTDDFNGLHKDFLHYKAFLDGNHDATCWCISKDLKFAESGIAMSFSEMKPSAVLMSRQYGSNKEEWLQTQYEIISPMKPFSKRVIKLVEEPYEVPGEEEGIPFAEIPELVEVLPNLLNSYPIKKLSPDNSGKYHFKDWLPMTSHPPGFWL